MTEQLDCVVIGAGVVGLAVGRSLALAGREVVVLEAEPHIGMHSSSRNSEVIHAGLYYPPGSLKARLCVEGKAVLYDYCDAHRIPVKRIGKLIVASGDAEQKHLETIRAQAERNGVHDLRMLSAKEARNEEPNVVCDAAMLSPSTGIIDSHALMLSLQGEIEATGGYVLTQNRVASVVPTSEGFSVCVDRSEESYSCRTLVNSAGLFAPDLTNAIPGFPDATKHSAHYAIGHYFAYQGKSPFNRLVYPVPVNGGLGIHATNDISGSARFGPDVEWIESVNYGFDESRKARFVTTIRQYFPGLDESRLVPAYTGIRPKLTGRGEPGSDFVIQGEDVHGIAGLINLLGIESPGLTACLAIGDYVARLAARFDARSPKV